MAIPTWPAHKFQQYDVCAAHGLLEAFKQCSVSMQKPSVQKILEFVCRDNEDSRTATCQVQDEPNTAGTTLNGLESFQRDRWCLFLIFNLCSYRLCLLVLS